VKDTPYDNLRIRIESLADKPVVALVDDDPTLRGALGELLRGADLLPTPFSSCDAFTSACMTQFAHAPCAELLVCRLEIEGGRGIELIEWLNRRHLEMPAIIYSSGGNISAAVKSLQAGALDFIDNVRADAKFRGTVTRVLAHRTVSAETVSSTAAGGSLSKRNEPYRNYLVTPRCDNPSLVL